MVNKINLVEIMIKMQQNLVLPRQMQNVDKILK